MVFCVNVALFAQSLQVHLPIVETGAVLLRREFLDRVNSYLVFTTHIPMTLNETKSASKYLGSRASTTNTTNSIRGCIGISMPFSTVLTLLRGISRETGSLTPAQVVLYGGIPALIYTALTDKAFDPDQRVVMYTRWGSYRDIFIYIYMIPRLVHAH